MADAVRRVPRRAAPPGAASAFGVGEARHAGARSSGGRRGNRESAPADSHEKPGRVAHVAAHEGTSRPPADAVSVRRSRPRALASGDAALEGSEARCANRVSAREKAPEARLRTGGLAGEARSRRAMSRVTSPPRRRAHRAIARRKAPESRFRGRGLVGEARHASPEVAAHEPTGPPCQSGAGRAGWKATGSTAVPAVRPRGREPRPAPFSGTPRKGGIHKGRPASTNRLR